MKHFLKKLVVLTLIVALLPLGFVRNAKATMTNLTVTPTPSTVSSNASYLIQFTIQTAIPASGTINVYFAGFTGSNGTKSINGFILSSTGGGGSIASVVVSNGPTLTITLGSAMNPGTVYLFVPQTAGIYNPATSGSYTVWVYTSSGESGSCSVPIGGAQSVTVTVYPLTAGSVAYYSIQFIPGISLLAGDFVYITFPVGSVLPSTIPQSLITVNNYTSPSVIIYSGTTIRITVPTPISAGSPCTVYVPTAVGIQNPPTAGSYSITVYTSRELTPISSAPYTLTGSNITNLSVTVSPNTAGVAANYYIQFMTGPSGALTANNIITINFPSGTVVPSSYSGGYITINGYPCTTAASGTNLYIYVPSGLSIGSNAWVYISILSSFGIINPTIPGTYTLKLSTSADTIPATSNSYTITGTSVSNFNVTVDPKTQNATPTITATFTTSSTGALSRINSDKIMIQFDSAFNVPSSISSGAVTVNNAQASYVSVTGNKITITIPVDISANSQVTVVISKNANIVNPSNAGTYQIKVSTSKDVVEAGDTVNIVTSIISKPQVQLTSYAVNDQVGVTIIFNTGSGGALTTSDTISIVFQSQFTLPNSISTNYVKVNNYNALQVTKSGYRLDIKPAVNIGANAQVTVIIDKNAGIKNPQQQGDYKISVYTSKETTPVDSDTFKIVMLPVTKATVTPAQPDGENGYYKTKPIVTLTATSPVDTNPQIYYYIDTGTPQLYTAPISIPDGIHTLYFYAKDKYGNTENPQSIQFKVDTVKPAITIISPQDNAVLNSKDITIKGSLSEQGSVAINGVPVTVKPDLTFEYSTTIVGKTTFTIVAKDIAGNTSQTTLTVSLDTTPPKLTVTKPRAFETVNVPYVDVEGVTDADAVKVTVNGQSVQVGSDFKFSYRVILTTEGLNSIDVIAEDLAGNEARQVIPINYVAKTKLILQVDNKNAVLNDKAIQLDAPPKIVNGRTLVPIRTIATAFNAEIIWEPVFKLVIIKLGDNIIYLQIGAKYASVNGKKVDLDVAPQIINNYTYVPLRFISESLNASVEWDGTTKTIIIIYPK